MRNLFRKKSIDQIKKDAAAGMLAHEASAMKPGSEENVHLHRTLGLFDLTMLGIAAIIGAGIFAMVGKASYNGGPAVIFLFVISAIACGLAALCYAEFASRIPIAGSAYTYSYASNGGAHCVDHRLGPDRRIRDRKYCGRNFLVRLFYRSSEGLRNQYSRALYDGFPYGKPRP